MVTSYDLGRGHQRDGGKSSGNNIQASHGAGLTGVGPSGLSDDDRREDSRHDWLA